MRAKEYHRKILNIPRFGAVFEVTKVPSYLEDILKVGEEITYIPEEEAFMKKSDTDKVFFIPCDNIKFKEYRELE